MPVDLTFCPANASTDGVNYWRNFVVSPQIPYVHQYRRRYLLLSCCDYSSFWFDIEGYSTAIPGVEAWEQIASINPGVPLTTVSSTTAFTPTRPYAWDRVRIIVPAQACITDETNKGAWCIRMKLCLEYRAGSDGDWVEVPITP